MRFVIKLNQLWRPSKSIDSALSIHFPPRIQHTDKKQSLIRNLTSCTSSNFSLELTGGYRIRRARKEDCGAIHHLIQELATSLKMPQAVQLDIKDLESDGFGDRSLFEGFVATMIDLTDDKSGGSEVVGYSTYYFTYSTWQGKTLFMEDMYIKPEHRKHGIALSFYHLISQRAVAENCKEINMIVLDKNESAKKLFTSLGAVDLTANPGWLCYRIHRQEIRKLAQKDFLLQHLAHK